MARNLETIEATAVTKMLSGHQIKRREKQMVEKLGREILFLTSRVM